jgi:hypothetical protein
MLGAAFSFPGSSSFAGPPGIRSQDWTQTSVADLATGRAENVIVTDVRGGELRLSPGAATGVYTSTVAVASFLFNAVAPHWRADVPQGGALRVELRVREEGWSRWYSCDPDRPDGIDWDGSRGHFYPEAPLLLSNGRQFQYRITMVASPSADRDCEDTGCGDGASPVLYDMTVTYIDASTGPTTAQAKAVAVAGQPGRQAVPQPTIISRAGWGADEGYRYDEDGDLIWPLEYRTVSKIIVHHTITPNDYLEGQAAGWVRSIYYYHAITRGWGDIGYNYLVDGYGNVYEGRYGGPDVVGGHVYGYNYGSMGVSLIGTHGNYTDSVPPPIQALASLADVSAWEASHSYVHPLESAPFLDTTTPNLAGHRDYPPHSTSCPGDMLYAELPALRQAVWDRVVSYTQEYAVDWLAWEDLPPVLLTNETYGLTMTVRNAGWLTWTQAGPPNAVRLGCHWLDEDERPIVQRPEDDHRGPLDHDVTFGHTYAFEPALVTTPITPGTYTLAWDMVHEGVSWFHDANVASPLLTMTVTLFDAPPVSITGQVLDVYGRPVGGAQIVASDRITTYADESGAFALTWLERGTYTLTASAEGYAPLPPAYDVDCSSPSGAAGDDVSYAFCLAPADLIEGSVNGGFENGLDGWTSRGVSGVGTAGAHTGTGAAQLGTSPSSGTAWISQRIALPSGAISRTLSLFYNVPVTTTDSLLQATLAGVGHATSLTYTLPLTTAGWTHFRADLPPGWWGDFDLQFKLVQGPSPTPTVVWLDEVLLGYRRFAIYLPLATRTYAQR